MARESACCAPIMQLLLDPVPGSVPAWAAAWVLDLDSEARIVKPEQSSVRLDAAAHCIARGR